MLTCSSLSCLPPLGPQQHVLCWPLRPHTCPVSYSCLEASRTQKSLWLTADWDGCKLPLEVVKWPRLPGRGHLRAALSADGFRGTCLDNESIWDNFPCELQLVSSVALACVTAARQAVSPGACLMANSPAGTWLIILSRLQGALHTSPSPPGWGGPGFTPLSLTAAWTLSLCVHITLLCFSVSCGFQRAGLTPQPHLPTPSPKLFYEGNY